MKTKEVECIKRLLELGHYDDFKDFIVDTKIAKDEDFSPFKRDFERAMFICSILEKAVREEKLILLDYEWKILPIELIKVICVTEVEKKEFIHGL